jgi:hypothetical protein
VPSFDILDAGGVALVFETAEGLPMIYADFLGLGARWAQTETEPPGKFRLNVPVRFFGCTLIVVLIPNDDC